MYAIRSYYGLNYEFVNGSGTPIGYAEIPGTVGVHYTVIFPDFDATIQMTANRNNFV